MGTRLAIDFTGVKWKGECFQKGIVPASQVFWKTGLRVFKGDGF